MELELALAGGARDDAAAGEAAAAGPRPERADQLAQGPRSTTRGERGERLSFLRQGKTRRYPGALAAVTGAEARRGARTNYVNFS